MVPSLGGVKNFGVEVIGEHGLFRCAMGKLVEDEVALMDVEVRRDEIPTNLLMGAKRPGFVGIGIPEECGGQGGGSMMMAVLTRELARTGPAFAPAVGVAQVALEEPMISYQAALPRIADLFTELEVARPLTCWAATLADQEREGYVLTSPSDEAFATEAAKEAVLAAIKVHSGVSVDVDAGVEGYLKDALTATITEGMNGIQRLTVIRTLMMEYAGLLRQIA